MPELATRLTRTLQLRCPVVSAPMAFAAGGALAAAVSRAGGMGLALERMQSRAGAVTG